MLTYPQGDREPLTVSQNAPVQCSPSSFVLRLIVFPDALETPLLSETTLLTAEENGFALEPVPITRTYAPPPCSRRPDENIRS